MLTKEPTRAKKIFARACIAICVGIVAFPAIAKWVKGRPVDYDYDASIAKLKKIGAALQLYRAEYGVKPVAERRTYSDAGLPPSMLVLARAGHLWSVSGGVETFSIPNNIYGHVNGSDYSSMYWEGNLLPAIGPMDQFYADRGEELPILADYNMGLPKRGERIGDLIILRLNGAVAAVTYDIFDRRGIYQK